MLDQRTNKNPPAQVTLHSEWHSCLSWERCCFLRWIHPTPSFIFVSMGTIVFLVIVKIQHCRRSWWQLGWYLPTPSLHSTMTRTTTMTPMTTETRTAMIIVRTTWMIFSPVTGHPSSSPASIKPAAERRRRVKNLPFPPEEKHTFSFSSKLRRAFHIFTIVSFFRDLQGWILISSENSWKKSVQMMMRSLMMKKMEMMIWTEWMWWWWW